MVPSRKKKPGKAFEEAVWRFGKAINPSANVLFDHKVPDRETKRPRQCDVWIETLVSGHWPLTIYVSCKDYGRRIDASHIDNFIRETEARSASMGVIYSRSGFTLGAIEKAKANGVCCCRLYESQPADIPSVLGLPSYVCQMRIRASVRAQDLAEIDPDITWNDIFDRKCVDNAETLVESLSVQFRKGEIASLAKTQVTRQPPEDFVVVGEIPQTDGRLSVRIEGVWRFFKGRVEAHLVDGSYCFSNGAFIGTQTLPIVNVKDADPGPGWQPMCRADGFPEQFIIIVKAGAPFEDNVRRGFGTKKIHER